MGNNPCSRPSLRRSLARASVVAVFLLWAISLSAQSSNATAWETGLYYGSIWRHTPKLTIRTGRPLWAEELGLRWQLRGRQAWHQWQRYPAFGLAWAHFYLGEQSHGHAFGLLPNLSIPLLRRPHWLFAFRLGTGLGYITRPYDSFLNPGQNAIGSHLNNFTQFRLSTEVRLSPFWRVQGGMSLSHFSNGSAQLPNFGVNLPCGYLSAVWSPGGIREEEFIRHADSKRGGRRFGALAGAGLALVEYAVIDGPRYPVWIFSGAGYYQMNRVNRFLLGAEYEMNRGVYEWGLRSGPFRNKEQARLGATRLALTLADEFQFGRLGVQLQAGVYVGRRVNQYVSNSWYSKLSIRYYFHPLFGTRLQPYAGIALKAHKTTAEYISLCTGLAF